MCAGTRATPPICPAAGFLVAAGPPVRRFAARAVLWTLAALLAGCSTPRLFPEIRATGSAAQAEVSALNPSEAPAAADLAALGTTASPEQLEALSQEQYEATVKFAEQLRERDAQTPPRQLADDSSKAQDVAAERSASPSPETIAPRVANAFTPSTALSTPSSNVANSVPASLGPASNTVASAASAAPPAAAPEPIRLETAAGDAAWPSPAAEASAVVAASHVSPETAPAGDWREPLGAAIERLEAAAGQAPRTTGELRDQTMLRMLYLAAGRRDDALRPISGLSPSREDFWREELLGLSTYLDDSQLAEDRRAGLAREHISAAAGELGDLAPLEVRNLAFCESITGFGIYQDIHDPQFQPGQQVLLYAEIKNFRSTSTDQ